MYSKDFHASCNKKNLFVIMISFKKILDYNHNYHDHQENNLLFFLSSNSNLAILIFSILSANTEPLVGVFFVFWKELNKCFLNFFLKSLFFAMLGILSTPLILWLKSTSRRTLSNTCPLFAVFFPLNRCLNSVYRHSTCW